MKMTHMCITVLAYFLADSLHWHVLSGKEKHLLNGLEKFKDLKMRFLENKQIKGQI